MPVGHYENFPVASLLLPRRLRPPVEIIYRFARSADDIADEGAAADDVRLSRLSVYRSELARIAAGETPEAPLFRDVARIVREYGLPLGLFRDLIDAFSQDVTQKRYANFAQLDMNILKEFKLRGGSRLQARWEIFNLTNRVNLGSFLSTSTRSSSFGKIGSTPDVDRGNPVLGTGGPRAMQWALKVLF